jgi:hypothetical protein
MSIDPTLYVPLAGRTSADAAAGNASMTCLALPIQRVRERGSAVSWFGIWWGYYYPGLRYALILNAIGIGLMLRAWQGDLTVLRGTTAVPQGFQVTVGLALQIPGAIYLGIGGWSLSQMARTP